MSSLGNALGRLFMGVLRMVIVSVILGFVSLSLMTGHFPPRLDVFKKTIATLNDLAAVSAAGSVAGISSKNSGAVRPQTESPISKMISHQKYIEESISEDTKAIKEENQQDSDTIAQLRRQLSEGMLQTARLQTDYANLEQEVRLLKKDLEAFKLRFNKAPRQ